MKALKWDDLGDVLEVNDIVHALGVSDRTVRKLLNDGRIKAVKCGNRWLCAKKNLIRFVEGD